ncbi:MAG: transcription termination/antitermination factor NusG [Planctomycetaceae bacterium]|nr:transcription termination/antitermination factor NusG [Planctomycetales bacterium]MCB9921363.1 transcription termination/antitermination factor NusG [Planctomycetaceae bacterium]
MKSEETSVDAEDSAAVVANSESEDAAGDELPGLYSENETVVIESCADGEGGDEEEEEDQLDEDVDVEPIELIQDDAGSEEDIKTEWYILKVQVNREESIRAALERKVKIEGLERYFGDIVVPTEDIAEFTKTGKRRIVKKKLYPGYIMVNMAINDDTWFAVRETSGIGDFTGSVGRPAPMDPADVERILKLGADEDDGDQQVKTAIPFSVGDRVRVKDGYFQNFEGDVEVVDEANGRVTVMINIFGRSTPVELEHWQIESV